MKDRFDLEQEIMDCWHMVDDIKAVSLNLDSLTEDQLANILLGIKDLYQLKFEHLFNTFSEVIQNGTFDQRHDINFDDLPDFKLGEFTD
jgi:hypothetical protein